MSQQVLDNVKRKNLNNLEGEMKDFDLSEQRTELILPLPGETEATFLAGIKRLMDTGANLRFAVYPHVLLSNTEMNHESTRKQYDLKVMFRQHHTLMGYCADEFVCETEKVIVSTSTMSRETIEHIRACSLLLSTLLRGGPITEFFLYLDYRGISRGDYAISLFENISNAPAAIKQCLQRYHDEYNDEIAPTEEEVISRMEAYSEDYRKGLRGGDVLKYSVVLWAECFRSLIDWIFDVLHTYTDSNDEFALEALNLKRYLSLVYLDQDLEEIGTSDVVTSEFDYDIRNWAQSKGEMPFSRTKKATAYSFKKTALSGSKKYTVLESFGLHLPDDVEVKSDGVELERLYMSRLRRQISYAQH